MKASSSKKNILKRIRQALETPVPVPFKDAQINPAVFKKSETDTILEFAEKFSELDGRFSFCINKKEFQQQFLLLMNTRKWKSVFVNEPAVKRIFEEEGAGIEFSNSLADCDASVTTCEYLLARTGTIVLSTAQTNRTTSVYAPVHICMAFTSQVIYNVADALKILQKKYVSNFPSLITFATGASRTADIEKTLVTGVHGPKEVFCFLIQS